MLCRAFLALPLALAAAAPSPAPARSSWAPIDGDRRSLEELLAEARAERAKAEAALLPKVTAAVAELDALERRARDERAAALVDGLVRLGSDVAPLLVQFLDPGEGASRAQIFRSERVADALARLRSASVTDALLERARSASLVGRLNALEVLGASPEPDRVAPALEALARSVEDAPENPLRPVRFAALRGLARLGGAAAGAILAETLRAGDLSAAEAALDAIVEVRMAGAAADVVALLPTPRGAALASRIAAFFVAVPAAVQGEKTVEALVQLCARDSVSREAKLALLDVLRRGDHKAPGSVKRELQTLRESLDQGVRTAVLVYLARMKDRAAKRDLFEPYDAEIDQNKGSAAAYEGRADLNHRIGDYNAAVRDWREVLKIQGGQNGVRSATPYVGLARSLAQLGKFKEAAEYLNEAPLSLSALQALAKDPDFAEMVTTKYRESFHLADDSGVGR